MGYTHYILDDPTESSIDIAINHFSTDPPNSCNFAVGSHLDNILLNCMKNLIPVIRIIPIIVLMVLIHIVIIRPDHICFNCL